MLKLSSFATVAVLTSVLAHCSPDSKSCTTAYSIEDTGQLADIARSHLLDRPGELRLNGLKMEGSDLQLSVQELNAIEPLPEDEVDHPMDRATLRMYAIVNEKTYRFSFDECGKVLSYRNLSGFDLDELGGAE